VSEDTPTPTPPSEAMERITKLVDKYGTKVAYADRKRLTFVTFDAEFDTLLKGEVDARTALLTAISDALAEGRKDRERLDWCQRNIVYQPLIEGLHGSAMFDVPRGMTLREALDAARAETGEPT